MEIEKVVEEIDRFRDARNWRRYHNAKDLSLSVSIEASELVERFQWVSAEDAIREDFEGIREEVADVLIYSLMLCSTLEIDPAKAIHDKLVKNAIKYPLPNGEKEIF